MKAPIYDQHHENQEWIKQLDFFKEEMEIYKTRLGEVAAKYTRQEVLAMVEHFQNSFIIHRNTIDELMHNIKAHEAELIAEVNSNPVAVDHRKTEYHAVEKTQMDDFVRVFQEDRAEFQRFLAQWM